MKQTTKNAGTDMALGMCFGAAIGSVIDSFVLEIQGQHRLKLYEL